MPFQSGSSGSLFGFISGPCARSRQCSRFPIPDEYVLFNWGRRISQMMFTREHLTPDRFNRFEVLKTWELHTIFNSTLLHRISARKVILAERQVHRYLRTLYKSFYRINAKRVNFRAAERPYPTTWIKSSWRLRRHTSERNGTS